MIDKVHAKIVNECNGWQSKYITRLLSTVYHDLIAEEAWQFVKELKMPTVNFRTLNHFVIAKVKEHKKELFA